MLSFLKQLPIQLFICLITAFFVESFLNIATIEIFYTISCLMRELLMVMLPFIIFSYIAGALISMKQKAPLLLLSILALATLSNAFSVIISYGVGCGILPHFVIPHTGLVFRPSYPIHALTSFPLTPFLPPEYAMIGGIICGLIAQWMPDSNLMATYILKLRSLVNKALQRGFIPFLPLYVFGFVLKLQYEKSLTLLLHHYAQVAGLLILLMIVYLLVLFSVAARFKLLQVIQNMLPAGITGFCTMSSAATMPLTLEGTKKNLQNPSFADLMIPTTVNIHLIGDALAIPFLAIAILLMNHFPLPNVETFVSFILYFCIAKFSVAGIPGGGIIVILPLLQTYFGLTTDMLSLITTTYILLDPFLTFINVTGNGAFALLLERLIQKFTRTPPILLQSHAITSQMIQDFHQDDRRAS